MTRHTAGDVSAALDRLRAAHVAAACLWLASPAVQAAVASIVELLPPQPVAPLTLRRPRRLRPIPTPQPGVRP